MPSDPAPLEILPLIGIPEVSPGDDLAGLLAAAATGSRIGLDDGDVLVVSSKVVSKALGLRSPDEDRESVVRQESRYVVAERRAGEVTTRIVRASAGPVMAAAGVDASNTGGDPVVLRLPHDPDGVCRDLRERLRTRHDAGRIAVVLTDTAGRPWRIGQTDFALGAAGLRCVDDLRGRLDADGRPLHVTSRAVADELAAAADLVKGKTARCPAVVVRGLAHLVEDDDGPGATALLRVGDGDWFGYGAAEAVRASLGVEPGSAAAQVVGVAATGPEPLPD
ncbi:MAG TPA: coenzyme F420-0:L-glutamate ligase, partial [Candidatus Lustribacter sp.]|nr:coenzyme F420-0:L-glutamate ligase [Candidatus Lustribacter sp.]